MNVAQFAREDERLVASKHGPVRIRRILRAGVQWCLVLLEGTSSEGPVPLVLDVAGEGCALESALIGDAPGGLEVGLAALAVAGGGVLVFARAPSVPGRDASSALAELLVALVAELDRPGYTSVTQSRRGGEFDQRVHEHLRGLGVALELLPEDSCVPQLPEDRPWVTSSHAQTVDGTIARHSRVPLLLSGPQSLAYAHELRVGHDAVLVGVNTVISDNPRLTARLAPGPHPRPIVLDSRLRTPLSAELFAHPERPWIFCTDQAPVATRRALESRGARLFEVAMDGEGFVDLQSALACMRARGVDRLLVEGGATILSKFAHGGFVDEMVVTVTPRLANGFRATNASLALDVELEVASVQRMGRDIVMRARPLTPSSDSAPRSDPAHPSSSQRAALRTLELDFKERP